MQAAAAAPTALYQHRDRDADKEPEHAVQPTAWDDPGLQLVAAQQIGTEREQDADQHQRGGG
jgi:hypothetical protein